MSVLLARDPLHGWSISSDMSARTRKKSHLRAPNAQDASLGETYSFGTSKNYT